MARAISAAVPAVRGTWETKASASIHRMLPAYKVLRPWVSTPMATSCSYNKEMEVGIRSAKNNLSKLVEAVLEGEEVFLTNRGARVAQLVPTTQATQKVRGRGAWKGKINLDRKSVV